jgi:hypothetical protein
MSPLEGKGREEKNDKDFKHAAGCPSLGVSKQQDFIGC